MDKTFPAQSQGYDDPESSPRFLPYELRLDADTLPDLGGTPQQRRARLRAHHDAAEWRTAYVAVTRARRRLYLTGGFWQGGKRPQSPSRLIDIARGMDGARVAEWLDSPGDAPDRLILDGVAGAPDPLFDDGWAAAVRASLADPDWVRRHVRDRVTYDARVDQLRMMLDELPAAPEVSPPESDPATSVTGLVTLASCPRRFYWSEIERLPRRPSPWLRHGVAVHRQIELHNLGRMAFDDLDPDQYDGVDDAGGDPGAADPLETFRASRFAEARPRFVETPIDLRIGPARIRGRIDAIYEPDPGHWEIVDFKSGRRRDHRGALAQLQAYAVAAADGAVAAEPPRSMEVTFAYLGSGAVEEVTHAVTPEWLVAAREHLGRLVEAMTGDEFEPAPGSQCPRCDFLHVCDAGAAHLASLSPAPTP
jgi:DNA helicase-2/ATP-dependent DNA helicase PcrA